MTDEHRQWKHHTASSLAGTIWFMGWLFTIAYAKLVWWQIIVGVVIWPYFIGGAV
jgi:hypothetical protein